VIRKTLSEINRLCRNFNIKTFLCDVTNTTAIIRFGVEIDIFIQVYVNEQKEKLNLALVVKGERLYGFDAEGGIYHEHPYENPEAHLERHKIKDLEEFVFESLEILKEKRIL